MAHNGEGSRSTKSWSRKEMRGGPVKHQQHNRVGSGKTRRYKIITVYLMGPETNVAIIKIW